MKRIFLTSALAISMIVPAFAETTAPDIEAGAESATCDSGTLNTTDGTSTLSAQWTANTITLKFYGYNNEEFATNTCTYDGGITLPASAPQRVGYNFAGWQVKQALFDLSTLDASISGTSYGFTRLNGNTGMKEAEYGLTQGSGEWATKFSYGTVKGMARCSTTPGTDYEEIGNPADSGGGQYCWCQATGYDAEKDGTYMNVSASSWVFRLYSDTADICANNCARYCTNRLQINSDFRSAVYGISIN